MLSPGLIVSMIHAIQDLRDQGYLFPGEAARRAGFRGLSDFIRTAALDKAGYTLVTPSPEICDEHPHHPRLLPPPPHQPRKAP